VVKHPAAGIFVFYPIMAILYKALFILVVNNFPAFEIRVEVVAQKPKIAAIGLNYLIVRRQKQIEIPKLKCLHTSKVLLQLGLDGRTIIGSTYPIFISGGWNCASH